MKHFLLKTWLIIVCLLVGAGTTWAEDVTSYSFTSKSWAATCNGETTNWKSGKDGNSFANNGVQVTTGVTGANATSPKAFTNVNKIVVTYCTNTKAGKGTVTLKVGNNAFGSESIIAPSSDGTTARTFELNSDIPMSGEVNITVNCTTNSIYIIGIEITETGGTTPEVPTVTAPVFDVAAGTYTEDQLVLIDNYDENFLYAYTLDGTDPAFDAELNVTNGTEYDNNEGIEITSSCTLKVVAVDEDGNASSITSAAYVINKPVVFASLEELVAADLETGTNVTVSFENVAIKSIFVTQQDYRNGVYFDIQKDGKDIEIFYYNVPEEWVVGGTLSGTMTCPWKLYSGTWELAPAKDSWAWTNLTYTAPAQKTITALAVSGTPTKTTYNVGDAFETAGLVVTATYSDETTATITEGFEWEIDYGTDNTALVASATSVDVMVYTDEVMSDVYTVNGLTVNVPVTLTSLAVSGTPSKTEYYAGDAFDTAGLVVTGTYSDGTTATITEGIEWTIDPETLALGTTSVDVLAGVGEIVSEVYTVEGITVTKPDFETATYEFSSFTSGATVELTDLEGFVITLKANGGTNPAWNASASEARVYAKGSLTVKANNAIIKSIEYTYVEHAGGKNNVTPTIDGVEGTTYAGTWDAEGKNWTGADEEVTFSTSGTAGNIGFTKLIIKYVETTKIETSLSWSATEANVTIGADDNVFPTLTTTPVDLDGVTYESSNTEVATIAEDGTITLVKAGETTITAKYAGDAEHASASPVSYTLTVTKAPFVPKPAVDGYETVDFTSKYSSVTTNATVEDYEGTSFAMAFAKPESSSTPTKYYDNGKAVRAYKDNTITITAAENITDIDIAWVDKYVDDAVSITGLGTTTAVVTFSKTCRFTEITVDYRTLVKLKAIEDGKYYATFSSDKAVEFVEAEVNTVKVAGNLVQLNEVQNKQVPANNGVLLISSTNKALYNSVENAAALAEDNMLRPASAAMEGDYLFYKLAYGDYEAKTGLGFYWGDAKGAAFTCKPGTAYLAVPTSAASNLRGFVLGGDKLTGIKEATVNGQNTEIFNLQGQRISRLQQGVNIVNGKKVIR